MAMASSMDAREGLKHRDIGMVGKAGADYAHFLNSGKRSVSFNIAGLDLGGGGGGGGNMLCSGNPLPSITSRMPGMHQPKEATQAQQYQHPAPGHVETTMLEKPVRISSCGDLHAGNGSNGSNAHSACAHNQYTDFQTFWGPHRTQTADNIASTASTETTSGMDVRNVEPLEACYRKMLGVDRHMHLQCHELEEPADSDDDDGGDGDEGLIMKRSSKIITLPKLKVTAPEDRNTITKSSSSSSSEEQYQDQPYLEPLPQQIPQIFLHVVTPPDSKVLEHFTKEAVTAGRPSPAPAPIASRLRPSALPLPTPNRLQLNIGLETPEYTLVDHAPLHASDSAEIVPRIIPVEVRQGGWGVESFQDWSGNPNLESFAEQIKYRTQPSRAIQAPPPPPRRHTVPELGISQSSLPPFSLGELADTIAIRSNDNPESTEAQLALDPDIPTSIIHGFDCPRENYIHAHFTKDALRRRWEFSQSYVQWPHIKNLCRDESFSEMEGNYMPLHPRIQIE